MALRAKLFKYILKKRALSYAASSDPPWGQTKPVRVAPTHKCPDCGELLYTAEGLHLHRLRKHKDTYKEASAYDSRKAFLFVINLVKMHQSRRKTKLSLGSLATATFVLVAVANFRVFRFVANTGRARAVILLPKSALAANL